MFKQYFKMYKAKDPDLTDVHDFNSENLTINEKVGIVLYVLLNFHCDGYFYSFQS